MMMRHTFITPKATPQRWLSGVATGLVSLHMILGCCWHHAHEHLALSDEAASTTLSAPCCHGAGHEDHSGHSRHSNQQDEQRGCHEPCCVFGWVVQQRDLDDVR